MISHFDFLAMISLFGLLFLLFILRLSSGTKLWLVIFCKLNLKIEYPQPFAPEVWDYGKTQTDLINRAIDQFDWVNAFLDKNIN